MNTKKGTKLGEPFGIGVYLHWSFWLLVGYIALSYLSRGGIAAMISGIALIFGIFGCVVLHELGHSLTARFFGIGTQDITLYPIGGVASLESMPRDPVQEMIIALAGPAVNVVIAIFLGGLAAIGITDGVLQALFYTNIALVLFNLIPAFPMDGGRVFRAGLSLIMPRLRATKIAAATGRLCAGLMALIGLFTSPMLIFIGIFIWMAAGAEQRVVAAEEAFYGNFRSPLPPPPSRFQEGEREVIEPELLPPEGRDGPAQFVYRS